jgi:hypothetical protein
MIKGNHPLNDTASHPRRPSNKTHMYSLKYNQQDATLYNILYCCQCSTCFRRFFCPSSGAQTVHTASGICQSANSPTLTVAASKIDIYQMLYEQFELLMMSGKTT